MDPYCLLAPRDSIYNILQGGPSLSSRAFDDLPQRISTAKQRALCVLIDVPCFFIVLVCDKF